MDDRPPFFQSWRALHIFVLAFLFVLIAFLALVTEIYA